MTSPVIDQDPDDDDGRRLGSADLGMSIGKHVHTPDEHARCAECRRLSTGTIRG